MYNSTKKIFITGLATLLLSGCDLAEDVAALFDPSEARAVIASVDSVNYASSSISVITGDTNRIGINELLSDTDSDRTVNTFNNNIYIIQRFSGTNIAKFTLDNLNTPVWQYSTQDSTTDAVSSNPQQIVFVSDTKAYVLRYGKNTVWVVNPSATTSADFKIGEIDLSAYADTDGKPEISMGVIANGKLFVAMQRLNGYAPENTAYIAVIDTVTDLEIDAGIAGDSLNGIPLTIRNPNTSMQYLEATNSIYIQGIGSYSPDTYTGGIEQINLTDYTTSVIVDDGTSLSHPSERVSSMVIVSPTIGYYVSYIGWQNNSIYKFNPSTGEESQTTIVPLISGDFSDLAVDANGQVWVSDVANASVHIIDPVTDTLLDSVSTALAPQKISFVN